MDLLSLAIVGAVASVVTQLVKGYVAEGLPRAILAIVIALVLGGVAYGFQYLPELKEALLGVLVLSNIAYGVVVKYLIPKE